MIKLAIRPLRDGMAGRAHSRGIREPCHHVVGYGPAKRGSAVPGGRVATHTVGRAQGVVVIGMAGGAGRWCR